MAEIEVGKVSHFFDRISVAAIGLTGELAVGDTIHIKGHTSDFTATVEAMQIEHASVQKAKAGDHVGVRVPQKAHEHDHVFKVVP
jgi:putative protease